MHRFGGLATALLQSADDALDFAGGGGSLAREAAHLVGHHGEPAPLFAGARRLDGSVEGQQVGLLGDVADHFQHAIDLLRLCRQVLHHAVGTLDMFGQGADLVAHAADRQATVTGLATRTLCGLGGAIGMAGDVVDGHRHLLHRLDHIGGFVQLAAGALA